MNIRRAQITDSAGIARVHVDSWRTSYAGIIADEVLANLSYAAREARWQSAFTTEGDQLYMYVAERDDGEIVGFALGGALRDDISGYTGELYGIYLLQTAQRSGTGRRLFQTVAHNLIDRGYESLLVWVLKDNHPARQFYEALGGQLVSEKTERIGDDDLLEVSYGWPDIRLLTPGQ